MSREVRRTVGVYDRPEKSRWPRLAIIAVVVLVLVIAASLALGYAGFSSRSTATSSARSVTRSRCTLSTQRRRM